MNSLYGVTQTDITPDDELYDGLHMRSWGEIEVIKARKERERQDKVLAEADAIRRSRSPLSTQHDPHSAINAPFLL